MVGHGVDRGGYRTSGPRRPICHRTLPSLLGLALLLTVTEADANGICDPKSYTVEELFCLRNPSSCDPIEYWQRLALRCAGYLRLWQRKPLQRLGFLSDGNKEVGPFI